MQNKIYVIETNFEGTTWPEAVENTCKLDADIQRLARASGEEVFLHQYKTAMLGAPVVLLECSESFLEQVTRLPLFNSVRPLEASVQTIRRSEAPQIEPPEAMDKKNTGPKGP